MRFLLCMLSSLILSACSIQPMQQQVKDTAIVINTQHRITFSLRTQTPITEHSLREHLGYGILLGDHGHILTAQHVLPDELNRLIIQDTSDQELILEQLWTHPTQDLALLKTNTKLSGAELLFSTGATKAIFQYFDDNKEKHIQGTLKTLNSNILLLENIHAKVGVSGSPVYDDKTDAIIGIITSDTNNGIEVTAINDAVAMRIKKLLQ